MTPAGSVDTVAHEAPSIVVRERGLTSAEAARQLAKFGPNVVETGGHFRMLRTGLGLLANIDRPARRVVGAQVTLTGIVRPFGQG